jgi:sporulation protein YlmC with PRC-barrel domain
MNRETWPWPLLLMALAALACRALQAPAAGPVVATRAAPAAGTETPLATGIPTTGNQPGPQVEATASLPAPTTVVTPEPSLPPSKPPQSQRAEIRPVERRAELTRASALAGLQVLDLEGGRLGRVAGLVFNTCETYLIYILLAPAEAPGLPADRLIMVPYEAVTINSGALDAEQQVIQLSLLPGHFQGAPAFAPSQALVPTRWETEVRAYWSRYLRISNLTTGCRVAAPDGGMTDVYKVAFGSQLIGATLHDALQSPLGQVAEIILEPESGKMSFFVVRLEGGNGLVLVPPAAVNIPKEAFEPGGEISLVLLTDNERLSNAPQIQAVEEAVQAGAQGAAYAYWGR